MGKTQLTGNLTNAISQDASNNIGIGAAPSGSYKLEVTGTAKVSSTLLVSGAATFSSSVSTGGALNITVPYSAGTMTILTQDNLGNGIYLGPRSNLNFDYGVAGNTTAIINNFGYQNGSAHFRSLGIGDGKGGTIAFFDGVNSRVGIGTGSPSYKLHVSNNTNGFITRFTGGTSSDVNIGIFGSTAGAFGSIGTESNHPFNIFTNGTDRMTITSGGDVQFGTGTGNLIYNPSATAPALQLSGSTSSSTIGASAYITLKDATNSRFWAIQANASQDLSLWHKNTSWVNVGNFSNSTGIYTPVSNINKKKDFEASTIGLNEVLQLKPTLYRMKADDESEPKQLGFLAQEVEPFIPQAYVESKGEDKFIGLNYNAIVAALVKAVQEQNQTIQSLQEQNQDLKSRLDKAGL